MTMLRQRGCRVQKNSQAEYSKFQHLHQSSSIKRTAFAGP
jgi:hypothetical protein